MVLPTVPFGVNTGQLDIPLTLNINPSTQFAILSDLAHALAGQGVRKLVVLNGHGGNDFRQMIRELSPQVPLFIAQVNWYMLAEPRIHFDEPGDHAGELETSAMQHIAPALVRPLSEAGAGKARKFRVQGLREGWAWAPRQWTKVTSDTGTGNPARATPEKGAKYLAAVAAQLSDFFVDLAASKPDDLYGEPESAT
jgi:creatinine amidohydrolase